MDIHNPDLFRHEQKYIISDLLYEELKIRLSRLMSVDAHANENGCYHISSLYFDDHDNSCYYDNENGNEPREKFRIRAYNNSGDYLILEYKRKQNGLTLKQTCPITNEQLYMLTDGRYIPDFSHQPPLLQRLTLQMQLSGLHPVIVADYDRVPFIYRNGNVRVTFDNNISSCPDIESFLNPAKPKKPILPLGQYLMEVKYSDFLPDEIYHTLQTEDLLRTAFSKYYLCRRYSEYNI